MAKLPAVVLDDPNLINADAVMWLLAESARLSAPEAFEPVDGGKREASATWAI